MRLTVTVTDTRYGCPTDTLIQRTVSTSPFVRIREQPTGVLDALFDFPISRAQFRWFKVTSNGVVYLPFENKAQFYPSEHGTFGVEVTDASSGCSSSSTFSYQPVRVNESGFHQDRLTINVTRKGGCAAVEWMHANNGTTITVYDLAGRVMLRESNVSESGVLPCISASLPRGIFYIVAQGASAHTSILLIYD